VIIPPLTTIRAADQGHPLLSVAAWRWPERAENFGQENLNTFGTDP